ncbi:MAG TPA: pyrroloquinoline quinone biosynthesis protein PqqE [Candidatus Eisenbacteria bacterium]|jgi:pyrroloquinoline quinone biosynthesis protein E|nr:pyrroloquinoline quinone biosynthesis protein PqqE [Candidatus Eisenbacteria bacterium]
MSTPNPLALIAELTHRCPLHCVYCSNPTELTARSEELPTEIWSRVFQEAGTLGVLQADLTGGEPLARPDILDLIRAARAAGLYVNMISSGMPLNESRLAQLVEAGLDHFQLSFQGGREEIAHEISGTKSHPQKLGVLEWLKKVRVAVTLNFVIHRRNIEQIEEMLRIAESSSATRVEFANVQYYGWAFANREHLLPTRAQLDCSLEVIKAAEERLRGKIRIECVVPDYYAKYPKPCMGGWGRKLILITPSGEALPCHAAKIIPGLQFDNVKYHSLAEIWETSAAFQRFRGEDWMQAPCKTCDRRSIDFGGCRCQALLIAADPAATDPVCSLSPDRPKVDAILANVNAHANVAPVAALISQPAEIAGTPLTRPDWLYRPNPA